MKSFYSFSLRGLFIACMFLFAATAQSAVADKWTDSGNYATTNWKGTGIQTDPYQIGTAAELAKLSYETNNNSKPDYDGKYFVLKADIDLSGHYWTPIRSFAGNFDGGGHSIKNMIFPSQTQVIYYYYLTLIQNLDSRGVIKNLHIGSDIFYVIPTSPSYDLLLIGSIVGENNGIISNCVNTGNINVSQSGLILKSLDIIIGGIATSNYNTIQDCYSTGNIQVSSSRNCYIGGIAGTFETSNASISNCFSTGTINTASITGPKSSGGVLGIANANGIINNSYFLQDATNNINTGLSGVGSGTITGTNPEPKTPAELKAATFVATLNGTQSSGSWQADLTSNINNGYPILKWQNPSITALPQTTVNAIKFYPNPACNYIELQGTTHPLPVKIFDMTGRMMINTQVKPGEKLNISALANGCYTINIDGQSLKMLKD